MVNKIVIFILAIIIICFSSCRENKTKPIPEKEMVSLLVDMQLAEAYASTKIHGRDAGEERKKLGEAVLAKHNLTQEQVDTTLSYYGRNIDDYSELFAKVDIEIEKRKKKLMQKPQGENQEYSETDLWPYGRHGIISDLGVTDGWIFSIHDPDMKKGDRLAWSLYLPNMTNMKGNLGVEYADGTSESVSMVNTSGSKIEITLHTDTSKNVNRIYGQLIAKDTKVFPVYADSIQLIKLPFDSIEYRKQKSQKRFGSLRIPEK